MRIVLTLLLVMLFVVSVTDFSPNSPSSQFPSEQNAAPTASDSSPNTESGPVKNVQTAPVVTHSATATDIDTAPEPTSQPEPQSEPVATPAPASAPKTSTSLNTEAQIEAEVLRLTNLEREKAGLNNLSSDTLLASVADAHSADMLERDFFSHDNPEGCSSSCRATAAGYEWRMVGENIFMMEGWDLTPLEAAIMIVNGWMSSAGHRANILKDGYTVSGVGVVVRGKAVYTTALYAKPR